MAATSRVNMWGANRLLKCSYELCLDAFGIKVAFRSVAWYSWHEQTQSMKRLLDLHFEWVLPGHGRRGHLPANLMRQKLVNCIEWMETTK